MIVVDGTEEVGGGDVATGADPTSLSSKVKNS